MTYPATSTPGYLVDHENLLDLEARISAQGVRACLVGFGEYAKHLINKFPDRVVAVYDPETWKQGIRFRGIPVTDVPEKHDVNLILACEYSLLYDYLPKIVRLYGNVAYHFSARMNYKASNDVNVFEQEELYKHLARNASDAPPSMMGKEKINLLIEMMRFGLTKPGDIVEMGTWQGGSAWFMGKALTFMGESRRLVLMDLFEQHVMDPTATMCTDEIRRRMAAVYDRVEFVVGLVDDEACLAKIRGRPICFAHMDLGPQPTALACLWDNLSPGAPLLLDNYGHLQAPTWAFDSFFEQNGTRVIRFPWSEQGLAFKTSA
jgi:predicted O-methyltransferase YrrM